MSRPPTDANCQMQLGGYLVFYGGDDGRGRNGILAVPYTINFQSALKNRPKYRTVFLFCGAVFYFSAHPSARENRQTRQHIPYDGGQQKCEKFAVGNLHDHGFDEYKGGYYRQAGVDAYWAVFFVFAQYTFDEIKKENIEYNNRHKNCRSFNALACLSVYFKYRAYFLSVSAVDFIMSAPDFTACVMAFSSMLNLRTIASGVSGQRSSSVILP